MGALGGAAQFLARQDQITRSMVDIIELPDEYDLKRGSQAIAAPPASPAAPPAASPAAPPVKVYLATPCYGCQMSVAFMASVLGMQQVLMQNGIQSVVDFVGNESLVERARNILAARFLRSDATHLLFIDADIGFRPEAVMRLLKADKDIATAVYSKKAFNWDNVRAKLERGDTEPVYQQGLDFNINIASPSEPIEDGFVKVLDSATGFMMIKRGVLERMAAHYREELHCVNDILGQDIKEYVALFACMIDPDTRRFLSEDYSFCRRYQALGGEIYADLTSPLAHIGANVFTGDIRQRL